jgi:hypothetical protein
VDQDQEQLWLLSIFHYIVGGLTGLIACFPIVHLVLGLAVMSGAFPGSADEAAPPKFVGFLFVGVASFLILIGWTVAACILMVGRSLTRHKYYTFCLVVAAIECLFVPFGTLLGIFTILVLVRPSVRALFEAPSDSTV